MRLFRVCRCGLRLWLCAVCLVLSAGCGTCYTVGVDALRDPAHADRPGQVYVLEPAEGSAEEDLLFRDIARDIADVFRSRGYGVAEDRKKADFLAVVSYLEHRPRTHIESETTTTYRPVRGPRGKVRYVPIEEESVTSYTVYSASLTVSGRELRKGKPGAEVWRTTLRCSGGRYDFRRMIDAMVSVLYDTMLEHSRGTRRFEVFFGDDGTTEVEELF